MLNGYEQRKDRAQKVGVRGKGLRKKTGKEMARRETHEKMI